MQSKAAFMVDAESRFVISGTPLQNSLTDLYCLVKFLRFGALAENDIWNAQVARRIQRGDVAGVNRLKALMKTICLRRTKETKFGDKPILALPERESIVVKLDWKYDTEKKMSSAFQDGTVLCIDDT